MKSNHSKKLQKLRALMEKQGVQAYLIPRADEYLGEFVPALAERLAYISGFTGSAGLCIVTQDRAVVMSDGRYTIQLQDQLDLTLFEAENSVTCPPQNWLKQALNTGQRAGYDPMLYSPDQIRKIADHLADDNITLTPIKDNLIDQIWGSDQPSAPQTPVFAFDERFAGASASFKLDQVIAKAQENGAQGLLIAKPASIAWLLNIRASDLDYMPVALSRLLIDLRAESAPKLHWQIDPNRLEESALEQLKPLDIEYEGDLTQTLQSTAFDKIALDPAHTPAAFADIIGQDRLILMDDPCLTLKAHKNEFEMDGIRRAHAVDGIAVTKTLGWLQECANANKTITEIDVANQLHAFRSQHPAYKGESFPAIVGAREHGAIVHYRADEHSNATLQQGDIVLIDSGGQYYGADEQGRSICGTTDITRTIVYGDDSAITEEQRTAFTLVLKGHIALSIARFDEGATGADLDALARAPLQEAGLDYAHGTGHGVGCFGDVHEDSPSLSPRETRAITAGLLLSNEPGYYKTDAYGIRTENLIFAYKENQSDRLSFETITLAPYDKRLIKNDLLSKEEIKWIDEF